MSDRKRVMKFFSKPSLTRQEFKQECDLGYVLSKFARTPEGLAAMRNAQGFAQGLRFEDVSDVPDFRTCRDIARRAEEHFMALPATLRRRFDNDAALFVDFVQDPKNLDELRALGLANPASPVSSEPGTSST